MTNAQTTVSQTTGLLTLEGAAEALGTTPVAVQRLIARGRLNATRLGVDGDYRISAAAVDQYIAKGAPDFDPPKFDFMDGDVSRPAWFDTPTWPAKQLSDALASMAATQSLSDADYERKADRATSTILVDVPISGEMRGLLSGPVDAVAARLPSGAPYKAKSAFDYWAANQLQYAALGQIGLMPMTADARGRLWILYDSPEQYKRIVGGAIDAVLQQAIFSRSEFRNRPKTASGPGDNLPIQIAYRLRVGQYASTDALRRISDYLAF